MWSWVHLAGFLAEYGYPLLLPLAVVEGPIVAILAGFLVAGGTLDFGWVLLLLVLGDVIGDAIYYALGRFGRAPSGALGRRLGLTATRLRDIEQRLSHDAVKMLCLGKWTHAIGAVVLVGAGVVRVPLPKFLLVNLLASLPKCAVLMAIGYFAGNSTPFFLHHMILGSLLLLAAGAGGIALILWRSAGLRADGVGP